MYPPSKYITTYVRMCISIIIKLICAAAAVLFLYHVHMCTCRYIISTWQPGMQSDAHEVMMGIINSRSALAVHIPNVIQFEMVTTGSKIDACVTIN